MKLLYKKLRTKIADLVRPSSADEDQGRKEKILNILLYLSIIVFSLINLIRIIDVITNPADRGLDLIYTLLILGFFIFLLWLARTGHFYIAAWLLIAIYAAPMFYSLITWGADLPAAIILGVLIITLAGVLIRSQLVLWVTALLSLFMLALTYLQSSGTLAVADYWRSERHELADAIVYALLFMMIAAIAQMFCRALEKALHRARRSETELRQERDLLEKRVAERSEELRQANAEKINQLYRLAEFGRLSSGVFHDLINPLSAISLNLEQVQEIKADQLQKNRNYLHQATLAAKKMEALLAGIKKQIQTDASLTYFSLNKEIKETAEILAYKARQNGSSLILNMPEEIKLHGSPIKFSQIVMNLLSNAIEANTNKHQVTKDAGHKSNAGNNNNWQMKQENNIKISLHRHEQRAILSVKDQGHGIAPENIHKIFEPFFSTKTQRPENQGLANGGLGLGLSSVKQIAETNFHGQIKVKSRLGQGSKFIVSLPLKQSGHGNND